jgi:hypothetical protein
MQPCASLWCRGWGDAPILRKKISWWTCLPITRGRNGSDANRIVLFPYPFSYF